MAQLKDRPSPNDYEANKEAVLPSLARGGAVNA